MNHAAAPARGPVSSSPIVASEDWRTTVCIASGPSRTPAQVEHIRAARERGACRVIVVNREWEWAPWADLLYAADAKFWKFYGRQIMAGFPGAKWTGQAEAARAFGINFITVRGLPGLSRDPAKVHGGQNSGYQAIGLAYHHGARRIILVGYDLQHSANGRAHHFGDHPRELCQAAQYRPWARLFDQLAADLVADGIDVINASPETALACFPRATLDEALP